MRLRGALRLELSTDLFESLDRFMKKITTRLASTLSIGDEVDILD